MSGLCLGLLGCGRGGDSLAELEAKARRNPDSVDALVRLGDAYMAGEMYHNAYIQYSRARDVDPASYEALFGLARAHEVLGNPAAGLEVITKALAVRPDAVEALNLQARVELDTGQTAEAARSLEAVLELEPDNEQALTRLPAAYLHSDRPHKAETAGREAVERLPGNVDAKLSLAVVLVTSDRSGEAEGLLREAMELAPDDPRPPYRLAELLVGEERSLEEAVQLADTSADLDPANGMPAALAAVALRRLGLDQEALVRLHEAALNYPRNIRLWLMMASTYRDLGEEEAAARAAAMALRFAPRRRTNREDGRAELIVGDQ